MANSCLSNYTLKGIGYDCNPNLAGIRKVWLTYYDDVTISSADTIESAHTITALTLSSGVTFYEYDFARDTSSLNSVLTKDDANGTRYYTNTLNLVFNKLTADKHLEVMALAAEKLLGIVEDNNGHRWLIGYDSYVSGVNSETTTGDSADSRNGYTVTIEGQSAFLPWEYTGEIDSTPAPTTNN